MGWYALTYENDVQKAVKYYERAYRLGSADATYNIGILYLTGQYPGKPKDVVSGIATHFISYTYRTRNVLFYFKRTCKTQNRSIEKANQSNDCRCQCIFHSGRHNVHVCKQLDGSVTFDIQCTQV